MKPNEAVQVAVLSTELKNLASKVEDLTAHIQKLSDKLDEDYVTGKEFTDIKIKVNKMWDKYWWMSGAAFVFGGLADFLLRKIFNFK